MSCPFKTTALLFGLLLVCACQRLSPERIEGWKATPEGRDMIIAVVKDSALAPDLRARAAAALVEIGWWDQADGVIAGIPLEERALLIPQLVPMVARSLEAADATIAWEARDALFAMRQHATTDQARSSIDAVLFPALEKDLRAGREKGSRRSIQDMMVAMGAASIPLALKMLEDPSGPFAVPVQVLSTIVDDEARRKGGAALARRAEATRSTQKELWNGIGTLGGKDGIDFLMKTVDTGAEAQADRAAEGLTHVRRRYPPLLPWALKKAGDPSTRPFVREQMLIVVENAGGQEARTGLAGLISSSADPAFRFRVFKAALKADEERAVFDALEAFPADARYDPAEVREQLVKPLVEMAFRAREGVFKALDSKSPLARIVAVWVLEKSGMGSDADFVEKVAKDKRTVKGFPPSLSVGREAARIAAQLRKAAG